MKFLLQINWKVSGGNIIIEAESQTERASQWWIQNFEKGFSFLQFLSVPSAVQVLQMFK